MDIKERILENLKEKTDKIMNKETIKDLEEQLELLNQENLGTESNLEKVIKK